ncbi:MAG: hypothetical protein ACK5AZ_05505 [Bryobacteraceae bacterium]
MDLILLWALWGFATAAIAYKRKMNVPAWFLAGLLLGPLGLLLAIVLAPAMPPARVFLVCSIAFVALVVSIAAILSFAH